MKRRLAHLCFAWLLCSVLTAVSGAADVPNIIVILADDMGYSDIGCYGGEIETPHLDALASGGLRFSQFYNTGRCCPTRASLLTGLYPHQAGVGWMMTDRGHDGYRGDLNDRCLTIAEFLSRGATKYQTYGVGKWHVTRFIQPDGPKHNWPLQRGFDRFYGTITGAGSFFDPGTLTRGNTNISPFADAEYGPEQYYYTDAISDHAVRYINEHSRDKSDQPFFMYVAYTCAHWPMHALEKDIRKYRGRYDGGYAPTRAGRNRRVRELGLVQEDWEMTAQVGDWESVEHKEWEARCMEVYAAMIDNMDQGIGRIVAALRERDQLDNTLIMFMQDNGGCQEGNGRRGDWQRPVPASLPKIADDAIRLDVVPKQNRAGVPTLTGPGVMPGPEDTYIAYGINWANVSNTPFREYKHFVHEGGIATPLIAHWPRRIQRHGEIDHQPAHLIDIMATCVDVADSQLELGDNIQPLEGQSLVPAFDGKDIEREAIYWEHEGNRAIRRGRWKLVAKENKPWELYDMEVDRTETNDVSSANPEIVSELDGLWTRWAKRANVLPVGTWRGKNSKAKFNKQQKLFELRSGDKLAQTAAPFIEKRPITIDAAISKIGDGVIVAQGGSAHGYALYVKDHQLVFSIQRGGDASHVAARLPDDVSTVKARLTRQGRVVLSANGKQIGSGDVPGLITTMPIDGLNVGADEGGFVGTYDHPFPFKGTLGPVSVKVGR